MLTTEVTPEAAEAIAKARAAHFEALAGHFPPPLAGVVLQYLAHPPYLPGPAVDLPPGLEPCMGQNLLALPDGRAVCGFDGTLATWEADGRLLYYKATVQDYTYMDSLDDGRVLAWDATAFHVWDFGSGPAGTAVRLTVALLCSSAGDTSLVWDERRVVGSPDYEEVYMTTGLDAHFMFATQIVNASAILNKILVSMQVADEDVFALVDVSAKTIAREWRMPHEGGVIQHEGILNANSTCISASFAGNGDVICVSNMARSVILGVGSHPLPVPESIMLTPLVEPPGHVLVTNHWGSAAHLPCLRSLTSPEGPDIDTPSIRGRDSRIWVLADGTILSANIACIKPADRTSPAAIPGVRSVRRRGGGEPDGVEDGDACIWEPDLDCILFRVRGPRGVDIEAMVATGPGRIVVRTAEHLCLLRQQ